MVPSRSYAKQYVLFNRSNLASKKNLLSQLRSQTKPVLRNLRTSWACCFRYLVVLSYIPEFVAAATHWLVIGACSLGRNGTTMAIVASKVKRVSVSCNLFDQLPSLEWISLQARRSFQVQAESAVETRTDARMSNRRHGS